MRFSELRVGDFFCAHGAVFLKLPRVMTVELPGANAINATTGQLAFFGSTVPVDITTYAQLDQNPDRGHGKRKHTIILAADRAVATRRQA